MEKTSEIKFKRQERKIIKIRSKQADLIFEE